MLLASKMLFCGVCEFKAASVSLYLKHCRTHRHQSKVRFPCGFPNCGRTFSSYSSFNVHVTRAHYNLRERTLYHTVSVRLKCAWEFCSKECENLKVLLSHLCAHLQEGLAIACPFQSCSKSFKIKSSFSAHVARYHKNWDVTQIAFTHLAETIEHHDDLSENNVEVHTGLHVEAEFETPESGPLDKYTENLALFFLGLQAKYIVPASTVTEIASEMRTLQDIQHEFTVKRLISDLQEHGVPQNVLQEFGKKLYDDSPLQRALASGGTLATHHRRIQFYRNNFNLVEPLQITLGHNDQGVKRHFQYIPILESLKAILKDPGARQQILNPLLTKNSIFRDITDGFVIKDNPFFASDPQALKIMLFQDSFEVCNPLGSARQKNKMLAVYYTLCNLYPFNRSTVDQIQLALLCVEKDCKYFGVNKVFEKLISDLGELELNGITVDGKTFRGSVACIVGDNLGSHFIGGFCENFSCSEYFCRYCLITK